MVQYSYPHLINSVTFSTPLPIKTGYSSSLFGPFETNVWIVLMAFYLVTCLVTFPKKIGIWTLLSIILNQSFDSLKSRSFSMRLLICLWLLSALVLKNYYCGELFGLMTFPKNSESVETIDEFLKAVKTGRFKIATISENSYFIKSIKVQLFANFNFDFIILSLIIELVLVGIGRCACYTFWT